MDDVEIAWNYDAFKYPPCISCETGVYKPDVVFFGENMRSNVRDKSYQMVEDANHMLIVGSSLQVYSSFRLLKLAKQLGHKVAALNLGEFRGMEMVDLWVNESSDKILPEVARVLQTKINT
ncbi:NAD-dependent protein deacetylase of SIR2 family [Obelidium mucronatum]|nr:NAD-dependent protein deacetylase of SIR2 family [Obelidium mucronatum]